MEEIFPIPEKEGWIGRNREEWERQQPLIISGKYNDKAKIKAFYKQKFVEYIRQLCPEVIEELRAFVPLFDELFGEDKDKYLSLFDRYKVDFFDLNNSLDTTIDSFIPYYPLLKFRPYKYDYKFRFDYRWGEYRVLLYFLYWLFSPADRQDDDEILQDALELLRENLVFQRDYPGFPAQFDESTLQNFKQNESERILKEFFINQKDSYFASDAKRRLPEILKEILTDGEPNVAAFITLQIKLLKWAKAHNLEKDWLLKYAYDLLKQFSDNPNLKDSEIQVGYLQVRSLVAFPFEFKFNGWIPGDEEKEKYEKRLRESFENELGNYFQSAGDYLNLEKVKKITKPLDYELVKPLVRKTVQKWSEEKIVEIDFNITNSLSTKRYFVRKVKYLKEELPKFENFNLPYKT